MRTHPRIVLPSGEHRFSLRYQEPAAFAGLPAAPDPLEQSVPAIDLRNPSAAQARHALAEIGRGHVPDAKLQDLVIGVSEAVNNALLHGRPPVTVRIWTAPGRIVVHVHDTGPGPADPLAGLTRAPARPGLLGAGLWVTHTVDIHPALIRSGDGFTIRLRTDTATVPVPAT
jgi:anti-sigma regulatory factor (Ser/Thr protein kinase)